jgi:hypothetical protein
MALVATNSCASRFSGRVSVRVTTAETSGTRYESGVGGGAPQTSMPKSSGGKVRDRPPSLPLWFLGRMRMLRTGPGRIEVPRTYMGRS